MPVPAPASTEAHAPKDHDKSEALHNLVLQSLDDDQAQEVVSIPLAGKLADKIKQQFGKIARVEGLPVADWVLIDADDVIVHLFRPEVRTFYNLERMWAFGDETAKAATP